VPLGNLDAFREWVERDDPKYRDARPVEAWIAQLAEKPWARPSRPVPEISNQPEYEVRAALLPDADGVEVIYRHTYDPGGAVGTVDLIWVGRAGLRGDG
jgi:hypothetical protein